MPRLPTVTPRFLERVLTPPDVELVIGLARVARAREQDVELTIREGNDCLRVSCAENSEPPLPLGRVRDE